LKGTNQGAEIGSVEKRKEAEGCAGDKVKERQGERDVREGERGRDAGRELHEANDPK